MKAVFAVILLINSSMVLAVAIKRSCPAAVPSPTALSLEQYSSELQANNISILPGNVVQPANVDMFLQSYRKFPQTLRTELVSRQARITIMEGTGVKTDPTFTFDETFDKRDWSTVPGSGGEVSQHHNIPTRIVINNLHQHHGSSDLVLHEHAHTLDSLYGTHGISRSGTWHNLIGADPSHMVFLDMLNGDYTSKHSEEAFAELFAYYFNCEATRKHMEETVPQIAEFFKNLNSVKDLLSASPEKPAISVFVPPTPASAPTGTAVMTEVTRVPAAIKAEECVPTETKEISSKIQPFTNLTPYLQNYPQPGLKPNAFQINYPVYPTRNPGASANGMK